MPDPRLVPIADWSRGTNQAPGFMRRAQGAAEEMVDLVIDLQGRPAVREGYTNVDTGALSIGTEAGEYTDGDQICVAHWLGDDDTLDGIKRLYRFPLNASWVQDKGGRLLFLAVPGELPYYIDIKENIRYFWGVKSPIVATDAIAFTNIFREEDGGTEEDLGGLDFRRDVNEIRLGLREIVSEVSIDASGAPIVVRVITETDIESIEIYIDRQRRVIGLIPFPDERQTTLFAGALKQGSYLWYWDGRDEDGDDADPEANYQFIVKIDSDREDRNIWVPPDVEREDDEMPTQITSVLDKSEAADDDDAEQATESDKQTKIEFNLGGEASDTVPERFGIELNRRFLCFTHANEDLNIESVPSNLDEIEAYDVLENTSGDDVTFDMEFAIDRQPTPLPWVTHIYAYISDEFVPVDHDFIKPIETGFQFRRVAELERVSDTAYESEVRATPLREAPVLDSYEHDPPPFDVSVIGAYGVGIWAASKNDVYFSKIGNQGDQRMYALPNENALVPHTFALIGSGQSPILHIHPAAHESALLCFKRDAIHVVRGKGVISGLYDPQTAVQVDADASTVIEGTGSASPRSVVTVGSAVYFVGSDRKLWRYGTNWRGQTDLDDVGLPIQDYLDNVDDDDLGNLVAFLYQNCYHLIMPDRVIVLDMTRKYWTSFSWRLKDALWSRGGINSESILYALTQSNRLVALYDGDTDAGDTIGGLWRSNPVPMPSESVITGVIAVHTDSEPPTVKCRADVDDRTGDVRTYTPRATNHFRCGLHKIGSRITVQLETDSGFPRLDRIQAEIYPR